MFAKIRSWFRQYRAWNRTHKETWQGYTTSAPFERTRLLQECLAEVQRQCVNVPLTLEESRWEREQGVGLILSLAGTDVTVFLYPDTAEIRSEARGELYRAEEWDHRTPEEFLSAFRLALAPEVARRSPASASNGGAV